jgi:hypothetical protein
LLDVSDILFEFFRQLLVGAAYGYVALPSWELLVDRFDIVCICLKWEVVNLLSIELVAYANLDGVEVVEDIGFHHDERCRAVHHYGVFECYEVEPSATAWTTSSSAKLMTNATEFLAYLIK